MSKRQEFMNWCLLQLGSPYIWGAKGEAEGVDGKKFKAYDCSGFVTAGYFAVGLPDWRETHNANALFQELRSAPPPKPGDLVLYGPPGLATHVMVVWLDGKVIGASGGSSYTRTPTPFGRVKFKHKLDYRPDVLGTRQSPFEKGAFENV